MGLKTVILLSITFILSSCGPIPTPYKTKDQSESVKALTSENGKNSFSVATLNVWAIKRIFGGTAYWRFPKIAEQLKVYDIVAIQEAWDRSTKVILESFPYIAQRKHANKLFYDSGIAIMSKFPILLVKEIRFSSCGLLDCVIAKKGALQASVQLPDGQVVEVFTAHLDASPTVLFGKPFGVNIRKKQLQELHAFMDEVGDRPTLLLGDFNFSEGDEEYLFFAEHIRFLDIFRSFSAEPGFTYDSTRNSWLKLYSNEVPARLDMIFLQPNHWGRENILETKVILEETFKYGKNLSDHFGLEAHLKFPFKL